jgi:hypothetical protein
MKHLNSSSVESLLRQDTPKDPHRDSSNNIKKGNSKLSRSKSMAAPPSYGGRVWWVVQVVVAKTGWEK